MHKIFAKPLFLGKKVIFLTECHSTNDELASLIKNGTEEEGTVILTNHQKSGKGQRGNAWVDEPDKNLLMSVLLKPAGLLVSRQYLLNVVAGLAVLKCAERFISQSYLSMKWPNDILVGNLKISGILIENTIKGNRVENSIVGIGFNLNQKGFGLPTATSLCIETGSEINRDEFAENLLLDLEHFLLKLKGGNEKALLQMYHERLYLKGESAEYRDADGVFTGTILGIDHSGKLIVSRKEGLKSYDVKEIEFLS